MSETTEEDIKAMFAELKTRDRAHLYLLGQHITDQTFYRAIKTHVAEIPLDPRKMQSCPACESVLCGICGACHELDRRFLFVGPTCPVAQETDGTTPCVAWSWAYLFLKDANEAVAKEGQS